MLLSRYKKNNVYPCKHQFYSIQVGFKGSKFYKYVFVMGWAYMSDCTFYDVVAHILRLSSALFANNMQKIT